MGIFRRLLVLVWGALAFSLLVAPASHAAGVATIDAEGMLNTGSSFPGNAVFFDASLVESDQWVGVKLSADLKTVTITDPGVVIVSLDLACTGGRGRATCTSSSSLGVEIVEMTLGLGNDSLTVWSSGIAIDADGGRGADTLTLGASGGGLIGGKGADVLRAGPVDAGLTGLSGGDGPDRLVGGPGPELLDGGAGADDILGGGGTDWVTYRDVSESVAVSLDGVANDGVAGEHDNVHADVENVDARRPTGGNAMAIEPPPDPVGGDVLMGSAAANILLTTNGPALVYGGGGNDFIDALWASSAELHGDDGDDLVGSASGPTNSFGGIGDDEIHSRNGYADTISCGAGTDTALLDSLDFADPDCESAVVG
jgi:Ca2+-binding RTX toxin-like protein